MTSKEWYRSHPGKRKEHVAHYKARHPNTCKRCGVSFKRNRKQLCQTCLPISYKERAAFFRRKMSLAFQKYKERRGCKICGYNRYGGSIDFHHKFGKESRILASDWSSKNDKWIKESKKCVLLCKNCHYEIHGKEKENGTI